MRDMIINRKWCSSFLAGGMRLELTGTCTVEDLKDAEKILEIAIQQIKREYIAAQPEPPKMVTDGFGGEWPLRCEEDGCDGINQVMRPGDVQCSKEHLHGAAQPGDDKP